MERYEISVSPTGEWRVDDHEMQRTFWYEEYAQAEAAVNQWKKTDARVAAGKEKVK